MCSPSLMLISLGLNDPVTFDPNQSSSPCELNGRWKTLKSEQFHHANRLS